MDAAATSPEVQSDYKICNFYLQIQKSNFSSNLKQNHVVKYTKLPDFDFDSRALWPQKDSYILRPQLRRIVILNDLENNMKTSRSLKSEMPPTYPKRKFVTISEGEPENRYSPVKNRHKVDNRATSSMNIKMKRDELSAGYTRPQLSGFKKQESKSSTKINVVGSNNCNTIKKTTGRPKTANSILDTKPSRMPQNKNSNNKDKGLKNSRLSAKVNALSSSTTNNSSPRSICKFRSFNSNLDVKTNRMQQHKTFNIKENEKSQRKNLNTKSSYKNIIAQPRVHDKEINLKIKESENKNINREPKSFLPLPVVQESKLLSVEVIRVPLVSDQTTDSLNLGRAIQCNRDEPISLASEHHDAKMDEPIIKDILPCRTTQVQKKIDCYAEMKRFISTRSVQVETDPTKVTVNVATDAGVGTVERVESTYNDKSVQSILDDLEVPNVTLLKERSDMLKKDYALHCGESLPLLQIPSMSISSFREDEKSSPVPLSRSASYIISRATLTYTTKQEFDIHMVGDKKKTIKQTTDSSSTLSYPMSVVSFLKNKILNEPKESTRNTQKENEEPNCELSNCLNYPYLFGSSTLVKPSKIISTISVNKDLLQSDYICEQFQRELNFIDSFFESLQYLENCTLSNKKVVNIVSKSGFDIKNPEYSSFFSKLENDSNNDDTETMASKSLCLLNLLIRDEQKRAKNLLFVLKMREAALKDFTKSQILWLENKKKQFNTDISTLKKKQRGALLKLQHECGEMQRMRKALLTLSENRKAALMKTKKNIELQLKNNVSVSHIFLGKKKPKRSSSGDRCSVPLKCFDLSSSGCEESSTSRSFTETVEPVPEVLLGTPIPTCAEKCVQTGESLIETGSAKDQCTDPTTENFLAVDGGYLNILFSNLSLPEIFSSGKQYEVNEQAMRSIVSSANNINCTKKESEVIDKFIEQVSYRDPDKSSTPSTARSLVDELDQYYKVLAEEDKLPEAPLEQELRALSTSLENNLLEVATDTESISENHDNNVCNSSTSCGNNIATSSETLNTLCSVKSSNTLEMSEKDFINSSQQLESLPVASEDVVETLDSATTFSLSTKSGSNSTLNSLGSNVSIGMVSSLATISTSMASSVVPSQSEAEELRRQQLAIEKEIKALEQQQCQLLVVREIPDKPPPPYTPPTEVRTHKLPRKFIIDDTIEAEVIKSLTSPTSLSIERTDSFDIFLQDYCQESAAKNTAEQSNDPWDAFNLVPQKQTLSSSDLVQKTTSELKEVLTAVSPTTVSGVGARRADHIDDILFAEWRRCESEWTALHSDEAIVKNQIFEGIFQKILSETIDEYKKTSIKCDEMTCLSETSLPTVKNIFTKCRGTHVEGATD